MKTQKAHILIEQEFTGSDPKPGAIQVYEEVRTIITEDTKVVYDGKMTTDQYVNSRINQLINELTANPQNIFQQTANDAKCHLLKKYSEKELTEIITPIVEKMLSQITIQVSTQKSVPDNL